MCWEIYIIGKILPAINIQTVQSQENLLKPFLFYSRSVLQFYSRVMQQRPHFNIVDCGTGVTLYEREALFESLNWS